MAKQPGTASGGGSVPKRKKPRSNNNPLTAYEKRHNVEANRLGAAQVAQTNRNSAAQRGPDMVPASPLVGHQNTGADIMSKITKALGNAASNKKLAKGLPPLKKPAPGIIHPGAGGNASVAGASVTGGSGVKAGALPKVNTGLNVNNKGIAGRAKNAAALEFDPQIDAIRTLIGTTQKEGQAGITDTTGAYSALQASDAAAIPGINKTYDDQQAKSAALYQQLIAQNDAQYAQTKGSNEAQFANLGISQADPTNGKLTGDQNFLDNIARLQGQGANDSSELLQSGAAGLALSNSQGAGLAGANAGKQLRQNLADSLLKLRTNKTSLVGSKAKSRRELQDQYTTEAQAQAERDRAFGLSAAQFNESVLEDRRNFKYNAGQDATKTELAQANLALDANTAANKQSATDFKNLDPQERAAAKAEQLVPGSGDRMFAYLQNLINSDKNIRRGFTVHTDASGREQRVPITAEQFGFLARKHAKITGLPAGSVEKIATAYWTEH